MNENQPSHLSRFLKDYLMRHWLALTASIAVGALLMAVVVLSLLSSPDYPASPADRPISSPPTVSQSPPRSVAPPPPSSNSRDATKETGETPDPPLSPPTRLPTVQVWAGGGPVRLDWGEVMSDAAVAKFLDEHNFTPRVLYMRAYGMSGTHRVGDEEQIPEEVIQEARGRSEVMLFGSYDNDNLSILDFVAEHAVEDIRADEELQTELRMILQSRAALKYAAEAYAEGDPVIFSVEVEEGPSEIDGLEVTRLWEMPSPHGGNPEYTDPQVEAMSVERMLQEVEHIRAERAELEAQIKAEQESPRGRASLEVYEQVSAMLAENPDIDPNQTFRRLMQERGFPVDDGE